jgi:hypothetical protein
VSDLIFLIFCVVDMVWLHRQIFLLLFKTNTLSTFKYSFKESWCMLYSKFLLLFIIPFFWRARNQVHEIIVQAVCPTFKCLNHLRDFMEPGVNSIPSKTTQSLYSLIYYS